MMTRRFLYMVLNNYMHAPSAWYTLHRIDPSRLFYPRGTPTPASPPPAENERLPDPAMSFYPPHSAHDAGSMEFALLGGRGRDRVVAVDHTGRGVLYDDYSHAVHPLPRMTAPKWCPTLSLAVDCQDGAYVIETAPQADCPGRRSVEALAYDHKPVEDDDEEEGWVWRPHAPPPYVREPRYGDDEGGRSGKITCHAAEGARIWVSTAGRGTYCLDTASGAWTKTGDWALPFRGRAVPVPEYAHSLWFGVSASNAGNICASNLDAAADEGRAPEVDQVWDGFAVPEGFHDLESHSYVVHLGDGRLCVAKFFETTRQEACDDWMCRRCCNGYVSECALAMFTGVEVEPGAGRWHRLIKHRSLQYSLGTDRVPVCVL